MAAALRCWFLLALLILAAERVDGGSDCSASCEDQEQVLLLQVHTELSSRVQRGVTASRTARRDHFSPQVITITVIVFSCLAGLVLAAGCAGQFLETYASPPNSPREGLGEPPTSHRRSISEEKVVHPPQALEEHVYALFTVSLIREVKWFAKGTEAFSKRVVGVAVSALTAVACILLQFFLVYSAKDIVVTKVADIQLIHNVYIAHMHDNNTHDLGGGLVSGIPEFFNASRFAELSEDAMLSNCNISLVRPCFIFAALLVWNLSVFADLRPVVEMSYRILISTPTVGAYDEMCEEVMVRQEGTIAILQHVKGLTMGMKVVLIVVSQLPKLVFDVLLLYIGCSWLVAIMDMGEILNGVVALEFMLLIDRMLYRTIVTERGKVMMQQTTFEPLAAEGHLSFLSLCSGPLWGLGAVYFSYFFLFYLQGVIPNFSWDMRDFCLEAGLLRHL